MTPATLTPPQLFEAWPASGKNELAGDPESPVDRPLGGRPTLEERLSRVWEGLRADGAADCPLCQGRMTSTSSGGWCLDCGCSLT